ncbi:hypothetical protein BKA62DRAFT_385101 [Auriculariales sp. MPI-PUGE-AT-0066]|nr:hypothetical protein BKA62DRAFT_385101 [Auriculariales sp. MPI-PUGE-AT-0066]
MVSRMKLFIWPGAWGLPSFDAHCLAAALYLQLVAPGKFALIESADPDSAPCGQLPYLEHAGACVSGLDAIIDHFSGTLDAELSPCEAATSLAWRSFVDTHLGTLLAHTLFAIGPNYYPLTRNTLASNLPVPQRYYAPARLRDLYREKLEHAGLWDVGYEDTGENKDRLKNIFSTKSDEDEDGGKIRTAFGRERVREKANDLLAPIARLLAGKSFVYQERPTSLDLLLAAHILLLVEPPYPDSVIATTLKDSTAYQPLVTHARLILSLAYPTTPGPNHLPPQIIFASPPSLTYVPILLATEHPWLRFASYSATSLAVVATLAIIARTRTVQ